MTYSSYLEPVCCSISSSNCCFLTCIQISQEADQVVWYSHLFQNFPQFIVIHTIKGFGIVNKAETECFSSAHSKYTYSDLPFRPTFLLDHGKSKRVQKNIYFCFIDYAKAFDYVDHNKLWKILKEMGIPDHLTCLLRNLYAGQEATIRQDMEQQTGSK